jgi:DNA topoisomerase I
MVRLRHSDVRAAGITRRRNGRGFRYLGADGEPVSTEIRQRITDLVIPPAWREVWICPAANGHIQAVGLDDAGRRQYLYHDEWRRQRDERKYDRVLALAPLLSDFRKAVSVDLDGRGWSRARVVAVALRMLDHGVFRTGGDQYAEENGSYGVATLLREHVHAGSGRVAFDYIAKGGVRRTLSLHDAPLARAVAALKRARNGEDRLLAYRSDRTWHHVHADDLNDRFRELVGADHTVKDLRTWHATVLAAAVLAGDEEPGSARAAARSEARMYRTVAEQLGNTPAVTRKSYVDPRLVDLFEHGTTIAPTLRRIGSDDLAAGKIRDAVEQAVVDLLSE